VTRDDRNAGRLSSFAAAAAALEAELERFEGIAASVARAPLTSQKAIEHAARLTRDASEAQGRYAQRLQALVAMVGSTGERQRDAAATINDRVTEIDARTADHAALERRLGELGEEARGINARAQGAIGGGGVPSSPERLAELIGALEEIGERMDAAVARALDVARDATAADFVDVARQADALRQQLLATRNRVTLLRRGLAS
jgi:hypothetical protein